MADEDGEITLRVAMVAPFGMQPKGTTRVRALPLAQALAARGHEVTLLVPPWDDRAAAGRDEDMQGVRVRQMALPLHPALDLPVLVARLLAAARAERPDILHVFKPKGYSGLVAQLWRGSLVVDADDWEGWGGWNEIEAYGRAAKHFFEWQEQWAFRHAPTLTVASRVLERRALEAGRPAERVAYVPNGPGAAWPTPPVEAVMALGDALDLGDAPVALLFTRFFEFDEQRLARRWAAVVAQLPAARLLVVGKGLHGEEHRFEAALRAAGMAETVKSVGWQPFEKVPAHFALARVALYPMDDTLLNRAKCPVKLADFMQAGLPVVGEAVGQVAEYLAGNEGGLLVPPGDDEGFVTATLSLLNDADEARRRGAAGRQRLAEHFAWPHAAARTEVLYRRMLPRYPAPATSGEETGLS